MRTFIMALLLALPVAACSPNMQTPANIADRTIIDERAAIGIEVAAKAVTKLGNAAVLSGSIDKERYKALSRELRAYVSAARTAYDTGNSADFATAAANANRLVEQIGALAN